MNLLTGVQACALPYQKNLKPNLEEKNGGGAGEVFAETIPFNTITPF
jgi:hypothetical protein